MTTPPSGRDRLRESLSRAYHEKKPPEVGDRWRAALMARVREIGPITPIPMFLPSFERLVWRLVPVTALLSVILAIFLIKLGFTSGHDALQSFLNSMEEWAFIQFFSA